MLRKHSRYGQIFPLIFLGLLLLGLSVVNSAEAQTGGPLSQYKNNIHQMHIIAHYVRTINGTTVQANIIQTVTAVAIRSQSGLTYWLIEKDHVDPQYFYRKLNIPSSITISFSFFVDTLSTAALIQGGPGDPIFVFKLTDTYAVLQDLSPRTIPDVAIATDPQENEAAIIALPQGGSFDKPATFSEASTKILKVPGDSPLFFITFTQSDNDDSHGAPVFVQRKGQWNLAGIRVGHGRSTQPNQSAVAKLPALAELISK